MSDAVASAVLMARIYRRQRHVYDFTRKYYLLGRDRLIDRLKTNGIADRRNVTIILMNEERQPVMRWHAENAWINKIEGPAFKASGNEVAIESIEIVHEGLMLDDKG